jgi:hypothetical protein
MIAANMATFSDEIASLSGSIEITGNRLHLEYTLTNHSNWPIVALDALHTITPVGIKKYDPQLAFVSFREPDQVVILRVIPGLPKGRNVEEAYVPWARRLDPSQLLKGTVDCTLPLREFNPYFRSVEPSRKTREATELRFVIEYSAETNLRAIPIEPLGNVYRIEGTHLTFRRMTLRFQLYSKLPVQLLKPPFEPVRE